MATIQDTTRSLKETLQQLYPAPEAGAMAQQVVEHVLQKSRLELSLTREQEVEEQHLAAIQKITERLLQQEPLQYVLGVAHFYDLELLVDQRVLIPRPETEELVHLILQQHKGRQHLHILDIGTGSGCIPIALATNLQGAQVCGLDVSADALAVARANAEKYKVNITWLQQDVFEPVAAIPAHSLDILISNPPYVLESEMELMRANVLEFEPHLALFVPDNNALKYYNRIAVLGQQLLKPGGGLYFEINERYGQATQQMLEQAGYKQVKVLQDLFGKERMVAAVWGKS
ncbi:peptide chain release factor N(5)-glutamine methyltransferase [Pontibacter qinzhouensis]|uniref:Release factor glutamine methyltransferase n=1 Tax=Pontibacter qinzhouensis TaxID=2603253 RepID=A0A5C8KBI9_9BACT|nr:peptide chain release factor N(5)-glutamine methyltransferase [Pontibacter qinzhouensis]TXK52871.1 peptide chain release factor N(5)-glutamine methyltransferase [Pontibacter qinzhouensis]